MASSKELSQQSDADLTQASAQLDLIEKAIVGDANLPQVDPEAMSRAIMERILNAETVEEAFTQQNLVAWRDLPEGTAVKIADVHFNASTVEGGLSTVYAVVDLVNVETGESTTVTCGGQNVLAQLVKGLRAGWFGRQGRTYTMVANKTANNYDALWLEVLPD